MTFDEFVKIHAQKLGRDAKMAPEVEALCKADHAMSILGILVVRLAR